MRYDDMAASRKALEETNDHYAPQDGLGAAITVFVAVLILVASLLITAGSLR